jgi:NitT/TauT family transport system permease protein
LRIFGGADRKLAAIVTLCSFALILGAWWAAAAANVVNDAFLPSPDRVAQTLYDLARDGTLWEDVWASFARISVGFLIASAVAIPLGLVIGTFRVAEAAIEPPVAFIRYMPAVMFIPLTIIWVGLGEGQKYLIVWLGTVFQQILMIQDNVRRVPHEYVDIGYTLGMKERHIVLRVVLPAALPGIWDTLRITLGWAWTWVVVAELIAASSGLGYRTIVAERFFRTDIIFAVIIVIGLLGLCMDQLMRLGARRLFPWAEGKR